MPYLPMVKAMAPKAPIGAAFIRISTSLNIGLVIDCRKSSTGLPRSPTAARLMPKSTEKNSTCRMLPSAKAPTTVVGMMPCRKPTIVVSCALAA